MIKEIKLFGARFFHRPEKKESMKINGFEYSETEVLEALKIKGYKIIPWIYEFDDETFPNGKTREKIELNCAVKDGEKPAEENIWYKVAEQEFKKKCKPSLI